MRKLLLVPFLSFLVFSGFSQGTINNASYLTFAVNRPMLNYGEIVGFDSPQNLKQWYANQHPDAQHLGGAIDVGTTFYIHPTAFVKGFKAGILVDFIDLGANYFKFTDSALVKGSSSEFDRWDESKVCHDLKC